MSDKASFLLRYGTSDHIQKHLDDDDVMPHEAKSIMANPHATHEQIAQTIDLIPREGIGFGFASALDRRPDLPSHIIEKIAEKSGDDMYIQGPIARHPNVTKQAIQHMIDHENRKFPPNKTRLDILHGRLNKLDK